MKWFSSAMAMRECRPRIRRMSVVPLRDTPTMNTASGSPGRRARDAGDGEGPSAAAGPGSGSGAGWALGTSLGETVIGLRSGRRGRDPPPITLRDGRPIGQTGDMATRVILDVDTGTDDAVALMTAALSPDLELVGATVVNGNTVLDSCVENTLR